ncbi:hypothetical protein LTR81_021672 [Elasticomyces elasticus]
MSGDRVKLQSVCQACRLRHIKCDDKKTCEQCRILGMQCVRAPATKFKYHESQPSTKSLLFSSGQEWVRPTEALHYYDETPQLSEYYQSVETGKPRTSRQEVRRQDLHIDRVLLPAVASPHVPSPASLSTSQQSPLGTLWQSAESQLETTTASAGTAFTPQEALLIRNYVEHMAQWADGPDVSRHFELEVPRRALRDPLLKHAVCTFSSRHINRQSSTQQAEALEHQDACLRLLIPAMSGSEPITENVLAAVAILRQNEEMDEFDNRFHLEGITRLLNGVSSFALSGGLGEATAWLCLREDIYVSLTMQAPIKTNLESFRHSTWLQGDNDLAWSNRMVLLLAELLHSVFSDPPDLITLAATKAQIVDWDRSKPLSFSPYYQAPKNAAAGQLLPEVWMLAPFNAVGIQHYHIAQLVLSVSDRVSSSRPFSHIHEHRSVEKRVRHHLLMTLGIASSNYKAPNTWFTAHHCLAVWGGCLRKKSDQDAALTFLADVEERIGWRVARLTEELTLQWNDDSD